MSGIKMNKSNYAEIMEDNIIFLNKYAPKCMTTSHIEDILRKSVEHEYPKAQELLEPKCQSKPVMSLDECKNKASIDNGYDSYSQALRVCDMEDVLDIVEEAAEIYAHQFITPLPSPPQLKDK